MVRGEGREGRRRLQEAAAGVKGWGALERSEEGRARTWAVAERCSERR